jgi:mono/diheme cytochrome c family protein
MKGSWFRLLVLLAAIMMFTACTTKSTPAASTPEPEVSEEQVEEVSTDEETAEDSEPEAPAIDAAALFEGRCAGCHGADRQGRNGPALLPETLTGSAVEYVATITNGRGGMPSFSNTFSQAEIEAIVEWLQTSP